MNNRYRDGSEHRAPAKRRANPVRAILVLALALLLIGLQPWNLGYSENTPAVASMDSAVVMSADHDSGDRDTGIMFVGHCLLHAGCAVTLDSIASSGPIFHLSDWPAFIASMNIGLRPRPDPKPPKFLA